jgi:hypothetical protein
LIVLQIFEVHVPSAAHLVPGTRVCAYWSQKYHHLYPGTVSDSVTIDPKLDSNFVNIELDDGDSRDIHFENVRFLPTEYPLVGQFLKNNLFVLKENRTN